MLCGPFSLTSESLGYFWLCYQAFDEAPVAICHVTGKYELQLKAKATQAIIGLNYALEVLLPIHVDLRSIKVVERGVGIHKKQGISEIGAVAPSPVG